MEEMNGFGKWQWQPKGKQWEIEQKGKRQKGKVKKILLKILFEYIRQFCKNSSDIRNRGKKIGQAKWAKENKVVKWKWEKIEWSLCSADIFIANKKC